MLNPEVWPPQKCGSKGLALNLKRNIKGKMTEEGFCVFLTTILLD